MEITKDDVKHVANLSKLAFDEAETAEFAGTLTKIVDMFMKLEEVDTTGVPFTSNVQIISMLGVKTLRLQDGIVTNCSKTCQKLKMALLKYPQLWRITKHDND